jgi:hypothetical protein
MNRFSHRANFRRLPAVDRLPRIDRQRARFPRRTIGNFL